MMAQSSIQSVLQIAEAKIAIGSEAFISPAQLVGNGPISDYIAHAGGIT